MQRDFMCSFHTVSGVMPGSTPASRHPLGARLGACASVGYRGYWLHWRDYLEQRAAGLEDGAIGALFDKHAMRHRGVEFFANWFLTEEPGEAERASFAAARAIGAPLVNVGGDFGGHELPRATMVARFGSLCRRAADQGLKIALEFVPWSDVSDIATALDFMEPENAGLVVDCWHVFRGNVPLDEVAGLPPHKVFCVQVSDAQAQPIGPLAEDTTRRLLCGEGAFNLASFAAALEAAGANVPWSVEIISQHLAEFPLEEAAQLSFESARRSLAPEDT